MIQDWSFLLLGGLASEATGEGELLLLESRLTSDCGRLGNPTLLNSNLKNTLMGLGWVGTNPSLRTMDQVKFHVLVYIWAN